MPHEIPLGHVPIADHAFLSDFRTLAVAKGSNVEVYSLAPLPKLVATLSDHDQTVTAVDIAPDGKIILCAQDRNAIVWTPGPSGYTATLVLLRIEYAATCARWLPSGNKVAVGSGDGVVAVCYFEPENDWWVLKHLKVKDAKRLSVLLLAWHPEGAILAVGFCDFRARVFSGYVKGIDERPGPGVWGDKFPFGAPLGEFALATGAGWIHDVAFLPSGEAVAFVAHDGLVNVAYPASGVVDVASSKLLPFTSVWFADEGTVVVGGYDCHPVVLQGLAGGWQVAYELDNKGSGPAEPAAVDEDDDNYRMTHALGMFKQMDLKGKVTKAPVFQHLHQNTITTIRPHAPGFSTSGKDGRVVVWELR